MKILIADNRSLLHDEVKQVVSSLPVGTQVEEVKDGRSALAKMDADQYDVAILEDNMPGLGGLEILQQMKQQHKSTKILIFSEFPEWKLSLKAFKLGASGYLSRFSALNVLNIALNDIALGDGYECNG